MRAGLLPQDHTLDDELAVVFREALLQGALLFFDEFESLGDDDGGIVRATFDRHLAEHPGVAILAGTSAWVPRWSRPLA